jgi:septal ring factor EnvC (AmiA/AmiB activator)
LIVTWTLMFALGGPKLSSGTWLPTWFTSQGYNFPLNLITTVAELFIGFLVATAANRAQNALTALLDKIDLQEEQIATTETNIVTLVKENTDLTGEIHTLTTEIRTLTMQVLKNATLIAETHQRVAALTAQAGIDVGEASPDTSPPETTA